MSLDTLSSIVGLTETFMGIAGFSMPGEEPARWEEVLGKLDEALDAIGAVDGKVQTAIDMILNLGDTMIAEFDTLSGEIDQVRTDAQKQFLAGVQGQVLAAHDDMILARNETDPIVKANLIAQAIHSGNEAIRTVATYPDKGLNAGAVAMVTLMQISVIGELGDAAYSAEPYKGQLTAAADALRESVRLLTADMEMKGGAIERFDPYGNEPGSEYYTPDALRITNVTGTYVNDYFNVVSNGFGTVNAFPDEILAAFASGGIGGVRLWLDSLTDDQISAELNGDSSSHQRFVSDLHYRLDAGLRADEQAAGLTDLLALADQWDKLASGDHLQGDAANNVITVVEPPPTQYHYQFDQSTPDVLDGHGGDDTLTGGRANNAIRGGAGNDTLNGLAGHDTLRGDDGADVLMGGAGSDRVDGGAGVDTASYADSAAGVTVSLLLVGEQATGSGSDTLTSIENLTGSAFADTLTGNLAANRLEGGAGNDALEGGGGVDLLIGGAGRDTLVGGLGADTASYAYETNAVRVTLAGGIAATVFVKNGAGVFQAEDTIRAVENLVGGAGGDQLTGDGFANKLAGGAGDDVLSGGGGNDRLYGDDEALTAVDGADVLRGGAGDDIFERVSAGVGGVDQLSGGDGRDTYVLRFTAGKTADVVTDFQTGAGGDLINLAAFGRLNASDGFGSGHFRLAKSGADTVLQVDVDGSSARSYQTVLVLKGVSPATLTAENFAPTGGFAQRVWPILGTVGDDTLTGTLGADTIDGWAGDDMIKGGGGADAIYGGAGNDTADYRDKAGAVSVTLAGSAAATLRVAGVAEDTLREVEAVYGGSAADTLTGDTLANLFRGGGGADVLNGLGGVDTADYREKTAAVSVTLNGVNAVTVKVGGINEDTLRNIENVYGGLGADQLTGDGLANLFRGGAGADAMDGAGGVDTADYADKTVGVSVTLNGATNAIVTVAGAAEDTLRNIENLTGGAGNDVLTGDAAVNVLTGGAGADMLAGRGGADVLDGGIGHDTADYSEKTTGVRVTLNGAVNAVVRVGGLAEDTLRNVENISGGAGNDVLTGDALANVLIGRAGADVLWGRGGADVLDGGLGRDVADYGDKTASVDVTLSASVTAEVKVGGIAEDTIRNVEIVYGGSGDDRLSGDGFANGLYGGGGDDVLRGGRGADTLSGGEGTDTADYGDKTVAVSATLNGAVRASVTVGGSLEDYLYNVENLSGGAGDDVLTGDALDNVLMGRGGRDVLDGAAGFDIADYRGSTAAVVVTLNGAANATVAIGGVDEDTLRNIEAVYGGLVDDVLTGDGGDNVLAGGAGADRLTGGAGADRFVLFSASDGNDIITDFQQYVDKLDLRAIDADVSTPDVDDAFIWVNREFTGKAGELISNAEYNQTLSRWEFTTKGDVNGDGIADFSIMSNVYIHQTYDMLL